MAVYGVLGPYFEEDMPAWSYGNRLFLNTWKDENGHWINGVYRTTSKLFYRKWQQGWPLYRHMLAACIKRKAFSGELDEKNCDDSELEAIAENEAQVNKTFRLPYLEKDYQPDYPMLLHRNCFRIRTYLLWSNRRRRSTADGNFPRAGRRCYVRCLLHGN